MLLNAFEADIKNNLTSKEHLTKIHNYLNNLSPNLMNFINKYKIKSTQTLDIQYKNNTKIYEYIHNMPFKTFIFNYYQINSVEKSSKIMSLCTKDFVAKKLNFSK